MLILLSKMLKILMWCHLVVHLLYCASVSWEESTVRSLRVAAACSGSSLKFILSLHSVLRPTLSIWRRKWRRASREAWCSGEFHSFYKGICFQFACVCLALFNTQKSNKWRRWTVIKVFLLLPLLKTWLLCYFQSFQPQSDPSDFLLCCALRLF